MPEATIILTGERQTAEFGAQLAPVMKHGDIINLSGALGAGKSTLARGLINALCPGEEAPSPTYTFVETYEAGPLTLWHFDLYRLERADDVWELGFEEALDQGAILIEWPERISALLPPTALTIRLEIDGSRRIAHIQGEETWARRLDAAGIGSW